MKSCRMSQTMFGRKRTKARPTPAQNHGLAKYLRALVRASPTMRPATKKTTEYLVISPNPIAAPIASHQRGSSVLSRRMVNQQTSTHQRNEKEVYWNSVASKSG